MEKACLHAGSELEDEITEQEKKEKEYEEKEKSQHNEKEEKVEQNENYPEKKKKKKKKKTYWKGSDLRVRLMSGMKSWYLSLQALLSDSPDGFLPIEWVLTWLSTPSTSTRNDDVDLRSMSSALIQLDRRDPGRPRRTDDVSTVRCCWCCCTGFRRRDSSRDIFTSRRPPPQLRRWQREAPLICDSNGPAARSTGPRRRELSKRI